MRRYLALRLETRDLRLVTSNRGSTLIEVMVAALITIVGVVTMAQMFSIAGTGNIGSRTTTFATLLAGQKLEELRGSVWALTPSSGALRQNTPGYVDHLDANGLVVGSAILPPATAVYTRRWSIEPYGANAGELRIVQVLVTRHRNRGVADQGTVGRLQDEARLVTMTARKLP